MECHGYEGLSPVSRDFQCACFKNAYSTRPAFLPFPISRCVLKGLYNKSTGPTLCNKPFSKVSLIFAAVHMDASNINLMRDAISSV